MPIPNRRNKKGPFDHESVPYEKLPISVRSYVKGIREFNTQTQPYITLIEDLPTFGATNNWFRDILSVIADTNEIIDKELTGQYRSYSQVDELVRECAQYLESVLDNEPSISIETTGAWDEDCPTKDDMTELVDRIHESIKRIGYDLHSYLIKSSI